MSYTPTKYPQGTFCWADVVSTDIEKSKKFLTALFGWTSEDIATGKGGPDYTMFSLENKPVAGGMPTFTTNMPSFWNSYIAVDNIDEIIAKAENLGAKITMEPMDAMDAGKMAAIQDPTGANVCLWQSQKHIGAGMINTVGAMCWNELYTKDIEKAKQFYSELFGWTYEIDKDNNNYTVIKNKGRSNGGMFPLTPEMEPIQPNWTIYFTVKNIGESLAKVKELGGEIYMPTKEINIGKIAMIADTAKATCMIIEMSTQPEEWVE